MEKPKTVYLVKANDDLVSHCRCERTFIGAPSQIDCPWCGCGWVGQIFAAHQKPPARRSRVHRSDDRAFRNREPIPVGREDLAPPTSSCPRSPKNRRMSNNEC